MESFWVLLLCYMDWGFLKIEPSFMPVSFESRTLCEETASNQIVIDSYKNQFPDKEIIFVCKEVKNK